MLLSISKPWLLLCAVLLLPVFAQAQSVFQGSLTMDRHVYDPESGDQTGMNRFRIDASSSAMRLSSDGLVTMKRSNTGIQTQTVLIRHDRDDLLFITSDTEAVQLTRQGMEQISTLLRQFAGLSGEKTISNDQLVQTSERKKIMGLDCRKIVLYQENNSETHVWITQDLNLKWGMLTDLPSELSGGLTDLLDPQWMASGSFPVLAETYRDGKLRARAELTDIQRNDPAARNIAVPAGMNIVSIADYLFANIWRR